MANSIRITNPSDGETVGRNYLVVIAYDLDTAGSISVSCGDAAGGPAAVAAGNSTVSLGLSHATDHKGATVTATFTPAGGGQTASDSVEGVNFVQQQGGGGIGG